MDSIQGIVTIVSLPNIHWNSGTDIAESPNIFFIGSDKKYSHVCLLKYLFEVPLIRHTDNFALARYSVYFINGGQASNHLPDTIIFQLDKPFFQCLLQ